MSDYRIEIPVVVTDQSDASALKNLESTLNRIMQVARQTQDNSQRMFNEIRSGAESASGSVERMGDAARSAATAFGNAATEAQNAGSVQESAANGAQNAEEQLGDAVKQTNETIKQQGTAAKESGDKAKTSFSGAGQEVDKFTQRVQKSQQTLRQMFGEQMKLIISAVDKATPILKEIGTTVKNLAGRVWNITMRVTDLVTAPLRKVFSMIANPATMALSVAGVTLGAQDFVSTYNEFETTMSTVQALTGAAGTQYDALVNKAKELGETTVFSASEAAEGMTYLGMAGWDTNQILSAMPGLLSLASAGATDLGTASDIVSDVMTAFGMSASEAGHAADVFARAATSSNTTVSGLGEALKYAAPVAKSFGMSLEDTSAALGMMANAGIKGSSAGTAVRSALLRLAAPAKAAQDWMSQIGLSFTKAGGQMKNLEEILADTKAAFAGLTQQEQLDAANDIFGKNAASAWLAVLDQGTDVYTKFRDSLVDSAGAAEEMSKIQLDNLAGDFKLLQSAAEGLKLSVMEELNPALRAGTQWITSKIPEIKEFAVGAIDTVLEKISEIKGRLDNVFNSASFKNADSFSEKFAIAWDKVIAEPFSKWWESEGRGIILDIISTVAEGLGTFWNGAINGIVAGLTGQEIDASGLNLSGFALAGAEGAKQFVGSFTSALNLGEILSNVPGVVKLGAGLFAGLKLAGAAKTIAGWGSQMSSIFGPLITQLGAMNTGFSLLQIAMGAIVSPAGIAALAIAGVTAALVYASNRAEEHREELLHVGETVEQAANQYKESAQQIQQYANAMETKREIELRITQGKNNQKEITEAEAQLADINGRIAWLEVRLADTSLTPEDIAAYKREIESIESRKAEIETALKSGSLTQDEIDAYQAEWNLIDSREAYLEAALKKGSLTAEDIAAYQAELDSLKGKKVELEAKLADNTLKKTEIDRYVGELSGLQSRTAEITAILNTEDCDPEKAKQLWNELDIIQTRTASLILSLNDRNFSYAEAQSLVKLFSENKSLEMTATVILEKTGLTEADAQQEAQKLAQLYSRKAYLEVVLTAPRDGTSVQQLQDQLDRIQNQRIQIEAEYVVNGEWTDAGKRAEFDKLFEQEQIIQLRLSASELTNEEFGALMEEYSNVEASIDVTLTGLGENGVSVEELAKLNDIMKQMADKDVKYTVAVSREGLSDDALSSLVSDLEAVNQQLSEMDIKRLQLAAAADLAELKEQNKIAEKSLPEQARQREIYKAQMTEAKTAYTAAANNVDVITGELEPQRREIAATVRTAESGKAALASELGAEPWWFASQTEKDAYAERSARIQPQIDALDKTISAGYKAMEELAEDYTKITREKAPTLDYLFGETGTFSSEQQQVRYDEAKDAYSAADESYRQQVESLQETYNGKKAEIEADAFNGLDDWRYIGKSLEEMAVDWPNLTEQAKTAVAEALTNLEQYNASEQGQYYNEDQKTNPEQIIELADKATLMAELQTHVQELADRYTAMEGSEKAAFASSEDGQQQLAALNEALQTLGLDGISSLDQLNDAMMQIQTAGQLLDQITLEQVQQAFVTLTGQAETAAGAVSGVKAELINLNGTVAHTYVYVHEIRTSGTGGSYGRRAKGGIITSPELSWIGEAGPEAIIPLSESKRERALDLYYQTGEMLGIGEFADGGIVAPYRAAIEHSLDDEDNMQSGWMAEDNYIPPTTSKGTIEGLNVSVNVAANPTIEINGTNMSPDEMISALRGKQKELAQMLGQEMADELEAIVSNMVLD